MKFHRKRLVISSLEASDALYLTIEHKRSSDLEDEDSHSSIVHDSVASPGSCLSRILPRRIQRKFKKLQDSQREWATGVLLCAYGTSIILFINVVLTITAASMSYSKYQSQGYNYLALYQGNCSTSKNLARGMHGLINVLSTLMLAASNYCMQCLSAPSRQSIDEAHAQRKWMHIGVPSLKNLRSIGLKSQILWTLLCITSVPIHAIYNSTVFSTLATREYGIYVASSDFDPNGPPKGNLAYPNCFDEHAAENMSDFYSKIPTFDKLPISKCQDAYAVDFNPNRGTVILVTNSPKAGNTSLLYTGTGNWPDRVGDPKNWGYSWMCSGSDCSREMLEENTKSAHGKWSISAELDYSPTSRVVESTVSHCLSEKVDEKCQFLFSLPLCLAVILCNSIKVLAMFLTAHGSRREVLLTIGDAMSSFLSNPDKTTVGNCLLSKSSIQASESWKPSSVSAHILQKGRQATLPKRQRWVYSVSRRDWILLIIIITLVFSLSGYLLASTIIGLSDSNKDSLRGIWNLGFGTVSPSAIMRTNSYSTYYRFLPTVLLANAPQIIVSMAYFLYNSTLTSMLIATEYDGYGTDRKPLRVSWPKGLQRSTYYLSLPYRYSICLLSASAALHWLISQSLFFVAIIPHSIDGTPTPNSERVTCGFSPLSIIFAMSLGVLMVGAILALGMRRFKSNIPLAGSCSAAISAACHPLSDDEHALRPIMWGEVQIPRAEPASLPLGTNEETGTSESELDARGREARRDQSIQESGVSLLVRDDMSDDSGASYGHCSFTSHEVITPSPLRRYA
ncbi:hypothetical protein P168DRAFT_331255 [Aspergillus campestris IBT 28561]|uniref:DUF6536 domain-containing protein n=1 Tax=Aspergillus campestris (strain IBT 28561) TaxID=1392248 RepID=A0A2I1DDI5_ASPC2|nr:uncharacterized protein P168DRAFT_331255 [Aspergillus campestris IBT 28561]PKY07948.1 hypothetical protein P168DRAFT_331255 [Aspergillus campestris IBT 28561]